MSSPLLYQNEIIQKMLLEFKQWLKFVGNLCLILCVFRGVLKPHGKGQVFYIFKSP